MIHVIKEILYPEGLIMTMSPWDHQCPVVHIEI